MARLGGSAFRPSGKGYLHFSYVTSVEDIRWASTSSTRRSPTTRANCANVGHAQDIARTSSVLIIERMTMTTDEVYEALKKLQSAAAHGMDKLEERCREQFDHFEHRLQRRIDEIWQTLDESGGPDR